MEWEFFNAEGAEVFGDILRLLVLTAKYAKGNF
jgi:hypothetical protein